MPGADGTLSGFGALDWAIVFGTLALVTVLGHRMAGRQASIRDFFLGGRKLPWYAVSASIVATEISAVTLVGLPAVVFREGGDLTYLQIGLVGSLVARALIAVYLVPAYYEREIYSPYDYMGARLGGGVRGLTTALFALGGVLAQSARVYLIAVVLEVILARELAWIEGATGLTPLVTAVLAITAVAVLWTWMGGIATVVWTDALLFALFLAAVGIGLWTVVRGVDGGAREVLEVGSAAGKLRLFDLDPDPRKAYTLWAALLAQSWAGVGAYGVDQLMAQRLFCCRGVREARRAILASYGGMLVTVLVGLTGVALYAWYREHPLEGQALALYTEKPDRIFPIFVLQAVPAGLKGLILAGAFAAAISSLDSILAALAQTVLSAVWIPWRARRGAPDDPARAMAASRWLVLGFGVLLGFLAVAAEFAAAHYGSVLDLALAMAGYTQGALLAGFALAFGRRPPGRDLASGFLWAAPLSLTAVLSVAWPQAWAFWSVVGAGGGAALLWCATRLRGDGARALGGLIALLAVTGLLAWNQARGTTLAWPWFVPVGCVYTYVLARVLARRS
jgi:SSS family solute:Na+ symporter